MVVILAVTGGTIHAERDYDSDCMLTVCMPTNDPEYDEDKDYPTINLAIENMPTLSEIKLGRIKIYPGTYYEALNSWYDEDDYHGRDLPAHCDLIGTGRTSVEIQHTRPGETGVNVFIVNALGDNVIADLTVRNVGNNQNCIGTPGWPYQSAYDITIERCDVTSGHCAIYIRAGTGLSVSDCDVAAKYYPCILSGVPSEICNCDLYPGINESGWWVMEGPGGVVLTASGSHLIEDVYIHAEGLQGTGDVAGMGLTGIKINRGDVTIHNVHMFLGLTTKYYASQGSYMMVRGVCCDGSLSSAIVDGCTIDVTGQEGSSGGYGSDLKVDGVLVEGGAEVEIYDTSISTNWIQSGGNQYGYEHLLYAEDGTITVDRGTCDFDPHGASAPDRFDYGYVEVDEPDGELVQLWDTQFVVQNSSGESVAWFDRYGNLGLQGELSYGQQISSTPAGSFILKDSSDDVVGYISSAGNMVIAGSLSEWCGSCSPASSAFIIKPDASNVAYIDFTGDLCLKKLLYENEWPID